MSTEKKARQEIESRLQSIRALLCDLDGEIAALVESSRVDDLTGLLRRRPFFQEAQQLLEKNRKNGIDCSVLMLDIDHFKRINDTYGHGIGDEVIRLVAKILNDSQSESRVIARYGGEEFVILMSGSESEAQALAEQLRLKSLELKGCPTEWKCTLSIGFACASKVGFDLDPLINSADQALYSAKRAGRNQVKAA